MYFLVNASPKPLNLATLNFAGPYVTHVLVMFLGDLDLKVNVRGKKAVFAMVYHRLLL